MRKVIHKFEIQPDGYTNVEVPINSKILSVIEQNGSIMVYILLDPDEKTIMMDYKFAALGTGLSMSYEFFDDYEFVGTVNCKPFVWHIFYTKY